MGVDIIGLVLAVITALVAALLTIFVLSITWSSLGILSLPVTAVTALFVLALGALLHASLTANGRS